MTNEEAIAILEQRSNLCRKFQHIKEAESVEISDKELNCPALFANQYRKEADAFDLAIRALKNKPISDSLTSEQLREMDGRWVMIKSLDKQISGTMPAFIKDGYATSVCAMGSKCCHPDVCEVHFLLSDYGKTWLAYAWPPVHIDQEAWEPCGECKTHCGICANYGGWDRYGKPKVCEDCKDHSNFLADDNFCSHCGRPLTPEAWAELEKRIGGAV